MRTSTETVPQEYVYPSKSLRVLHVYRTYFPDSYGGIEQAIRHLTVGTGALGVENRIAYLGEKNSIDARREGSGRVYRFPRNLELASTGVSASLFKHFSRLARWADIVHYHFPWPFADLLCLLRSGSKPSVVTYHSDIVRQRILRRFYAPLMHRFLARASAIVATSPNYFATSAVLWDYRQKTTIIPIGLDESLYPSVPYDRVEHWRERLGSEFMLFIGNLRYYKGLHILLDAARDFEAPVVIVGSGPTEKELRERARRLGLKNAHFLGLLRDEDKLALLELCRAVVFSSHLRAEAFGVSLLEGAMRSKPLISSEINTGTSFVNIDGLTGIVVPPGDSAALQAAMRKLLRDPDLAGRLGRNARKRFEELFQADRTAQRHVELYRRVLGIVPRKPTNIRTLPTNRKIRFQT